MILLSSIFVNSSFLKREDKKMRRISNYPKRVGRRRRKQGHKKILGITKKVVKKGLKMGANFVKNVVKEKGKDAILYGGAGLISAYTGSPYPMMAARALDQHLSTRNRNSGLVTSKPTGAKSS